MFKQPLKTVLPVILGFILLLAPAVLSLDTDETRTVQPSATSLTQLTFQDLDLDIPAGASTEAISVSRASSALDGITLPYGFKAIGEPYRFGPSGLEFSSGKELKARFTIEPATLKGHSISAVKMYYINTGEKTLELVPNQSVDAEAGVLNASIEHFSSYVLGVSPSWDGSGINPFMDYIHNGEEHVSIAGMSLSILSPVYNVKGRGLDINLVRAFGQTSASDSFNPFYISQGWHWAMPYIANETLYLPSGGSYKITYNHSPNSSYPTYYDFGETVIKVSIDSTTCQLTAVYLNDGTKIQIGGNYQVITDPNGNWIRYDFTTLSDSSGLYIRKRINRLTDSCGHTFNFYYSATITDIQLQRVEQQMDSGVRTILSRTASGDQESFTDALGRTTAYSYTSSENKKYITRITYPNGLISAYQYDYKKQITSQSFTRPGSSTPARTVIYTPTNYSLAYEIVTSVTVNDGNSKKIYNLTYNNPMLPPSMQTESPGYTKTEETYTLSGTLLKRVNTSYQFIGNQDNELEFARPLTVSTAFAKADGTLGTAATFTYTYDNWSNVTSITDPYGTITRMGYGNTNSNSNLCDFTPATEPVTRTILDEDFESSPYEILGSWLVDFCYGSRTMFSRRDASASKTITIDDSYGTVSFNCYVESMQGQFLFKVDGQVLLESRYGTRPCSFTLSKGTHQLEWLCTGDPSGRNIIWVDNINITQTYVYTNLPQYQNYCFTSHPDYSNIGYNKLLTKAVFVKDPVHNTTQLKQTHFLYDSAGNLKTEREVYGSSYLDTTYTYDSYGNMLTRKDANGNELRFDYGTDAMYLRRVYRPDGTTIATYPSYDVNLGLPLTITDPKGNVFRYTYDAIGRLTKEALDNPDPQVGVARKITYDDAGSMVTLDFGNGAAGQWQQGRIFYDSLFGKPSKIERKMNDGSWRLINQFAYDSNGRLITERDNMNHVAAHAYDSLDREIQTTLPDGTATAYAWDDRTLTVTDANNNQKKQTFDLLDRIITVLEKPDSSTSYTTSYRYDTDSRLIQITNPRGAKTTNTYDNLGRLTRVDYPQDGTNPLGAEVYTYDNVGNLKTRKIGSRNPKTMEYEFFAGYRLKKVTEPDGRMVGYTYDANDNMLTQSCPGVLYSYSNYDSRNRAHNFTAQLDGYSFDFGYDYDVFGRMTSMNYPNRVDAVSYTYDELDRLQSIPGFVTSCGYDLDSKLTDMLFGNGMNNHYEYRTNDDKLAKIQVGPSSGLMLNLSYSYDNVGNIKQINNDYYSYDGLNRLTWAGDQVTPKAGNGTVWSYDATGNRVNHKNYSGGVLQEDVNYTYDLANRLWTVGSKAYTNDEAGARVSKSDGTNSWAYQYDGESRLVKALNNSTVVTENTYDGSGMRVKKNEDGKTVYFVYNGNDPIIEYSATDSKYIYYIYAGKQTVAEESGGVVKFYHKDHLGSTRVVTDSSGNKVAEYTYEPFGKVITGADGEQSFTGKKQDSTGLFYFGARFYDPELGKWITQDPAKDGTNWFAYCKNNPINVIDPDGLCGVIIGDDPYTKQCSTDLSNWAKQNPNNIFAKAINAIDSLSNMINNALNDSISSNMRLGIIFVAGPSFMADMAKSESLLNQALKGEGRTIAGYGTKTVLRDANRLAAEYGGESGYWAKMTTTSEILSDGRQIQVHYYVNVKTGQVVECKTKITPAKSTSTSTNSTGSANSTGSTGSSGSTE